MFRFAPLNLTITHLNPERAIEGAVLDRFADVLGSDVALTIEIGNRTRDLEDAIVSACAQIEFGHRNANQILRIVAELAMLFQLTRGHARVAIYFWVIAKTILLTFARADDALANRCRGFFSALAGDVAVFDSWHFDVQIDAVEQGAGNSLAIPLHLHRAATAFAFEIAKVSARTGLHGRDQHELARKGEAARCARHSNFPVL